MRKLGNMKKLNCDIKRLIGYCGYLIEVISLMSTLSGQVDTGSSSARNPIIWADVPDMAMIRVGDTYYINNTTIHLNPGVPIMKSKNLVN